MEFDIVVGPLRTSSRLCFVAGEQIVDHLHFAVRLIRSVRTSVEPMKPAPPVTTNLRI